MRILIRILLSTFALAYLSSACAVPVQLPSPAKQTPVQVSKNYSATSLPKIYVPIASNSSFQVSTLMEPGSLRTNIERLAHQFGWSEVVWDVSEDYEWIGKTSISGVDLNSILEKILVNYPLQATLYHGNHVLVISSRNL